MRMRRSKRSAQSGNEENSAQSGNEEEAEEAHPEADDHHHHHHDDDDGDDHQHHHQADDHHHHDHGVNADQDPWSWMRLEGTNNRSRRDVRYVPKFIETALVLDKAMVD